MTNVDLGTRFKFLGIADYERARIRTIRPIVAQTLPDVLDQFYLDLTDYPEVNSLFSSAENRKHARDKQLEHWLCICEAKFDSVYLDSVARIGEAHARIGLAPSWYFGAYAKIISGLQTALLSKVQPAFGFLENKQQTLQTRKDLNILIKVVMLDMDLCMTTIESCKVEQERQARIELAETFERSVASVISSVASVSEQLAQTARSMSATADNASGKSASVANAAEDTSTTAKTVAQSAHELTQSIAEIAQSAGEAAATSAAAESEAGRTNEIMSNMATAAEKIGEIVNLIENVAEQTNLLALNATIEAARAGEAGKGFAVVASEVKGLASQTAKATDEISEQIHQVQNVVGDAVKAIEMVSQSINQVSSASTSISAAVEEQNAATAEITRNIELTAENAGIVATTIGEVLTGTKEASASAGSVVEAAEELGKQATQLRSDSAQFIDQIKAV